MTMETEWQVASSAARLAEGDTENQNQTKAGGGGQRQVPRSISRTLWAEEDEEGEGHVGGQDGEEENVAQEGRGGVDSGDKERIVAFIRRMAFNVGPDAMLHVRRVCIHAPDDPKIRNALALWHGPADSTLSRTRCDFAAHLPS